jgi:hypothetical protein
MKLPRNPDIHHDDFHSREFRPDQTAEFLRHYGGVFRDAFNPYMEQAWQTSIFTGYGKKIQSERKGVRAAIQRVIALADAHGVDIRPFQWLDRYVRGDVRRDAALVDEARYAYGHLCLRIMGSADPGWGEYDEEHAAESINLRKASQFLEEVQEFASSLTASVASAEALADATSLENSHFALSALEEWRRAWKQLRVD